MIKDIFFRYYNSTRKKKVMGLYKDLKNQQSISKILEIQILFVYQ